MKLIHKLLEKLRVPPSEFNSGSEYKGVFNPEKKVQQMAQLCIKTSNFEAMVKFFEGIYVDVENGEFDQMCPMIGKGRSFTLNFEEQIINIVEDTTCEVAPMLNIVLFGDYSIADIKQIKSNCPEHRHEQTWIGMSYVFITPDGGEVIIGDPESDFIS